MKPIWILLCLLNRIQNNDKDYSGDYNNDDEWYDSINKNDNVALFLRLTSMIAKTMILAEINLNGDFDNYNYGTADDHHHQAERFEYL